jgi:Leucine-rich repeat (LRR) protein
MPSLEILDISRNKIKRLPTTAGSLVNLKVSFRSFRACLRG